MHEGQGLTPSLATTSYPAVVLLWQWSVWMGAIYENVASDFCNVEIKYYFVTDIISTVKYLGHLS